MANLGNTFDANQIPEDERGDFDPLPAGEYLMQISDSELREKDNGDTGLNLTLEVVDGPLANRKVWDYLNIVHSNATAQSIAQRRLADYCLACGVPVIQDSEELHFTPFIAKVAQEKRKDTGEMSNRIKAVRAAGSAPPENKPAAQQAKAPAQRQAAPPAARGASRPWGNRASA